jgi:hypothetical protein
MAEETTERIAEEQIPAALVMTINKGCSDSSAAWVVID